MKTLILGMVVSLCLSTSAFAGSCGINRAVVQRVIHNPIVVEQAFVEPVILPVLASHNNLVNFGNQRIVFDQVFGQFGAVPVARIVRNDRVILQNRVRNGRIVQERIVVQNRGLFNGNILRNLGNRLGNREQVIVRQRIIR